MIQQATINASLRQIKFGFVIRIVGGVVFVLGFFVLGMVLFRNVDYLENLYSESFGIIVTIFVLDQLARHREEQREEKALKERLVMEAGSQSNETAKRAIHELEHRGWLQSNTGLLKGAYLEYANLQEADLARANLQETTLKVARLEGANLWGAHLQKANLWGANLERARLWSANLQKANLWGVNLQKVNLRDANLGGANLVHAKLKEADLINANLEGANLKDANLQYAKNLGYARFDETTTLPDGTQWTPDTDLTRFTDPNHPNFWRSDNPNSPAIRGKESPNTE